MKEGLKAARFLMVLSSISPLFIIWAISGNELIPDKIFISFCVLMIIVPNLFLYHRFSTSRRLGEKRKLVTGKAEDHRNHLLVYLFTMLLPFYAIDFNTWRDLVAVLAGLAFIIFLFWHLNLHYMNIILAIFGLRIFTIYPTGNAGEYSSKSPWILITRRINIPENESIIVYRISDTVYIEVYNEIEF
jgi:hypothetical protein